MNQDFIERVREAADIIDVISQYVNLKRSGKSYRGLCPFHPDRTPSFFVDPEKGVYHCFGCGASGNVFRFIMEMEHITFQEALLNLARRYGIEIPQRPQDRRTLRLTEVTTWASREYHRLLFSDVGKEALNYLRKRKFQDEILINFAVGFSPPSGKFLIELAKSKKIPLSLLAETGLITRGENGDYFDYFRHRIIFPIKNPSGTVIAFGGRGLAENAIPKYINSPDTRIFKKGEIVFGLPEAKGAIRELNEVLIVEGYLDVLALHQEGFKNVLAPLGTALTEKQSRLISRYTKKAILLFDGDEAGEKAVRRSLPVLLKWGVAPKVGLFPEGEDPASLVEKGRVDLLKETIEKAYELVPFYFIEGFEDRETFQKRKFLEEVVDTISQSPDPILRAVYLKELAQRAGVMEELLKEALEKKVGVRLTTRDTSRKTYTMEFKLISYSLLDEGLKKRVQEGIIEDDLKDRRAKEVFSMIKSGMTREEILAEIDNKLRESIIEILIDAPDLGAVTQRVEKFLLEKALKRHKKALLEAEERGDKEKTMKHLMEIKRIKSLLGGKGGI